MKFTVYTHFKNVMDYDKYIPILCYPEKQSQYDVGITFNVREVTTLSNQSGLYIVKKRKFLSEFFRKLFKKSN